MRFSRIRGTKIERKFDFCEPAIFQQAVEKLNKAEFNKISILDNYGKNPNFLEIKSELNL